MKTQGRFIFCLALYLISEASWDACCSTLVSGSMTWRGPSSEIWLLIGRSNDSYFFLYLFMKFLAQLCPGTMVSVFSVYISAN